MSENEADFTFVLLHGTSPLELPQPLPKTEDETIGNFEDSLVGQTSTPKFVPHKRIRVFLDDAPESLRPLLSEEVSWSSSIFTPPRYTTSQQVSHEDSVCDYNSSIPFDETWNSVDKSDCTRDPDADYTHQSSKCENTAEPCNVEKVDVLNEPQETKTNVARKLFKATAHEKELNSVKNEAKEIDGTSSVNDPTFSKFNILEASITRDELVSCNKNSNLLLPSEHSSADHAVVQDSCNEICQVTDAIITKPQPESLHGMVKGVNTPTSLWPPEKPYSEANFARTSTPVSSRKRPLFGDVRKYKKEIVYSGFGDIPVAIHDPNSKLSEMRALMSERGKLPLFITNTSNNNSSQFESDDPVKSALSFIQKGTHNGFFQKHYAQQFNKFNCQLVNQENQLSKSDHSRNSSCIKSEEHNERYKSCNTASAVSRLRNETTPIQRSNHELNKSSNKESTVNKDFVKNKVHSLCDENVEGMQNINSISENPNNENGMESDIRQLCNLSEKDFSIWLDVTENCDKWIESDEWTVKVDDKTSCSFVQSSVVGGNNDNVCSQRCNEHETCLEKQENSNVVQNKRVNNLQDKQDRRKFRLGLSESAKMKYINNSNSGTETVSGYVDNKQNNSDSKLTNFVSSLSSKYSPGKLFWNTGIHPPKRVNDECQPLTTLPDTKRMKRYNADVSRDQMTPRNVIQPKPSTSCNSEAKGCLPVCGSVNIVKRSDAADNSLKNNKSSNSSDIHIIDSATDKIPETKMFDTVKRSNNNEKLKVPTKFQGFSTASGREVLVSKEALNKAKQFLSEKEIMKDAALSSISVDHLLNNDMLEVKRKTENEKKTTLQDNDNRLEGGLPYTNDMFARSSLNSGQTPFHPNMNKVKVCNVDNKTSTEKYVNKVSVIGERKVLRPQNSFVNNTVTTISEKVTSAIDSCTNFQAIKANKQEESYSVTSMSAVGGKSDIKTQQVVNRGKKRPCEILANEASNICGFSTASGKKVEVSKLALNRAKEILSDCDKLNTELPPLNTNSKPYETNSRCAEIKETSRNSSSKLMTFSTGTDNNSTVSKLSLNEMKGFPETKTQEELTVHKFDVAAYCNKTTNSRAEFQGFSTASGKNINLSKKALSKARQIFSESDLSLKLPPLDTKTELENCISNSVGTENKENDGSITTGKRATASDVALSKMKIISETRTKLSPSEGTLDNKQHLLKEEKLGSKRQGFSRVSGEKNELSEKAMNEGMKIFSRTDVNSEIPLPNTLNDVNISEVNLHKSRKYLANKSKKSLDDTLQTFPNVNQHFTLENCKNLKSTFEGFSTASGIMVDVSQSALNKVRQIFSEKHLNMDSLDKVHEIQKDFICKIEDFAFADVEEQVVPENINFMAHKKRKISINKCDEECKTDNLSYTSAVQCTTDGNKTSQVSKCNTEQISKKVNLNRVISPEESSHSASGDGSGKSSWFEYNEQSLNPRLNREMSLSGGPHFDYKHKNFTSKFQGFSTASGRKVSVPEKALSKARQLFVETDKIVSVANTTDKLDDPYQLEVEQTDKQNQITCVTIHTIAKKNGTEICPSKVLNVPLEADWNKELISMNSYTGNDMALQKFSDSSSKIHRHSTASGNKISVSDETLNDMKQMLFEDDFETEFLPNLNREKFSNQDSEAAQEKCYTKYKTKEFQKSACETVNFCDGLLESSNKPHSDKSILKHEFENNNMFNSTSDQTEPSVELMLSPVLGTRNVPRPDRGKYNKNIIDNGSLETHVADEFDFATSPVIGSNNKNICHVNSKTATIDLEKHKDVTIKDICSLASDQSLVKRAQSSENIRRIKKCLFEIPKSSSVFNAGGDTTHIKMKPESKSSTRNISINSNLSEELDETGNAMTYFSDTELESISFTEKSFPVTSYVTSPDIFEDRSMSPVVSFVENDGLPTNPVVGLEGRYNMDHSKHLVGSSTDDQEVRCQNVENSSSILHPRKREFRFSKEPVRSMFQHLDSGRNSTRRETHDNRMKAISDQEMRIEEGRKTGVKSYKGSYFQKRKDSKLIPLKDVVSGHCPGTYSSKELIQMGIKEAVVNVTAMNAVDYRFSVNDFCSSSDSVGISTEDGALLVPDHDGFIGVKEFTRAFLSCSGVDPSLSLHEKWISNHYRWIVWKLACTERSFPQQFSGYLSPNNVMAQLRYRYDREMECNQRPALRKILERDDASTKRLVLCVANITKKADDRVPSESKSPELSNYELELTDGWYSVMAAVDVEMTMLIESHRVTVGTKLMTCGAELVNCSQGCSPLEADKNVRLRLHTNSTRRARWCTKLGFQSNPDAFPISLSSVLPNGGIISCVPVVIARVYPVIYLEKLSTGKTVYRGARAEEREAAKFEKQRQDKAEEVLSQLRKDMIDKIDRKTRKSYKRNNSKITSNTSGEELYEMLSESSDPSYFQNMLSKEQKQELISYQHRQQDNLNNQLQARLKEKLEDVARNVVPVMKVRCLDANNLDKENGSAVLSVWRASEDVMNIFKEGTSLKIFKVNKSGYRSKSGSLQLSSGRNTRYEPLEQNVIYPERRVTELRCLADIASFRPLFGEVDIVGVVVCTRVNSSNSETVYMADGTSLAAISFWGSVKDFGYEDILMPEKVVAASNLHWQPRGDSRIPNVRASEVSVFSQNPRQRYLREALESLQEKIGPNVKSFVLQCKELIYKPEKASVRMTTGSNNTSLVLNTSYVLNMSTASNATNMSLPITPCVKNSTKSVNPMDVPAPTILEQKLKKLEQYGEASPLPPLHLFSRKSLSLSSRSKISLSSRKEQQTNFKVPFQSVTPESSPLSLGTPSD